MARAFLTVVYSIGDKAAFKADEWPRLQPQFMADEKQNYIHALSRDDELYRVQLIEKAVNEGMDSDVIREILQCADLSQWKWDE